MERQFSEKLKVVIVEDSASIRSRLVSLVEEVGNLRVVGEAVNEVSAIKLIAEALPDIVILDMQLETGSGLGVMKAIKLGSQKQLAEATPLIIVLTNFPSPSVQRATISLGAEYFLDKSLEFHKLPALLNTVASEKAHSHSV